ncbi:thioredoxin domain-containing protein [Candidatus Peregrinibacteria bacterium]|nr:thioredoxin domain-containing protein [Candidatus Peregrinibacteria bacterium]MBI3816300.1 thioredoxin domain-containing protein [Candidatus Peregrinibacteria bacterium]
MKRTAFVLLILNFALTACVDTTDISPSSSRPPRGNPQASILVQEFADLQCPSCRSAQTLVVQPLLEKYGSQIRFEYRHFPIQSLHRYALDAAEAAECAADQGKFWEFVDLDYANQDLLNRTAIQQWAQQLKLDTSLFSRCTRSRIKRKEILADYDEGTAGGVTGTPTFFVNGQKVDSTIQALSAAIDAAIKGTGTKL